ncbi:Na+/H+ antiporter subunit G [Pseudogracilibacillus sp. ICA-222130]|uniref:Na+/H+ antiporter subunit G n=1 Tax=Pseudogracilibacillus sp. ICA-222130 TaxID=3134655 RepID=UPI00404086F2
MQSLSVNEIFEFFAASLILLGSIISVISAIGIIRFRDVYSRAHAATKTTTVAILTTLIGVFLYVWNNDGAISVRLMLGIVFVFITAPVSGHLVLRASYRANVKMTEETVEDELKLAYEKKVQEEAKKEND